MNVIIVCDKVAYIRQQVTATMHEIVSMCTRLIKTQLSETIITELQQLLGDIKEVQICIPSQFSWFYENCEGSDVLIEFEPNRKWIWMDTPDWVVGFDYKDFLERHILAAIDPVTGNWLS